MTSVSRMASTPALPVKALGVGRDLVVGTLLCLSPVTAILALGWITRRMATTMDRRWGEAASRPGWIMGHPGGGVLQRWLGGLSANIEAGLRTAAGLFVLTLPVTLAWLGAWWAGWENSFNKGYEQSAVGPAVWMAATLVSLPVLAHLPLALAHAAAEGRVSAFLEWRRIRSIGAAAGWRLVWIAILSVAASALFFATRVVPTFIEGIVPGFTEFSATEQAEIAGRIDLLSAALAFVIMAYLRHRAAVIYALAAPRAAHGKSASLWDGHRLCNIDPQGGAPSRLSASLWLLLACVAWLGLPVLIVAGQFLNYAPVLWIFHPVMTLPWIG
jgi:hypothetical protein